MGFGGIKKYHTVVLLALVWVRGEGAEGRWGRRRGMVCVETTLLSEGLIPAVGGGRERKSNNKWYTSARFSDIIIQKYLPMKVTKSNIMA